MTDMAYTGKGKLAAVAGLCALFVTVLIFFQVFPEQDGLRWFGLLFIVLGETLPVAGFIWCENHLPPAHPPGARGGRDRISLLYGAAARGGAVGVLF
ncbi:MAG: hypothetical protein LBK98_03940, partial [Peptococcaceae bacterium]|nr:hypothetical protein [Peptococcaceae bacterium]